MKKFHRYLLAVLISSIGMVGCETEEPLDPNNSTDGVEQTGTFHFIYAESQSGRFEIIHHDGENTIKLTQFAGVDNWWPRVNPATRQILYYSSDVASGRDINDYSKAELRLMNADGANNHNLIKVGDNEWMMQGLANWSNDGQKIVLAAMDSSIQKWQIFTCKADGSEPTRVSLRGNVDYLDPIFDIDDRSVFCVTIPEGIAQSESNYEIVRIDLEDGTEERITTNENRDQHPSLSPDGKLLVYESLIDPNYLSIGKWCLMQTDLDTKSETKVLENEHILLFPRFTKDGDHVIYTRLNVESFSMTIGEVELSTGESILLLEDKGHSMNADPL